VSVKDSGDLYKLDLDPDSESVDILSLESTPADMEVYEALDLGPVYDRTAFVYTNKAQVDLLEHDYFAIETLELEEPTSNILEGPGYLLLYNAVGNTHDVYRVDLDSDVASSTEYVVANPVMQMWLSASGAYAVGTLDTDSGGGSGIDAIQDQNYGLAILDMATDDASSLVLPALPVGVAVVDEAGASYALVLLEGFETLFQVNLAAPGDGTIEVDLPAPPVAIGSMPDGRFYITHDAPLGMVSFLDPSDAELETVSGFGSVGLFTDDTLPRRD
jgi:hypothetical protein